VPVITYDVNWIVFLMTCCCFFSKLELGTNCNVASTSVSLHTFSFMALYKFVFNFNLTMAIKAACFVLSLLLHVILSLFVYDIANISL